jgi:hypothetical protein
MLEPRPEHRLAEMLGTCADRLNDDVTLGMDDVVEHGTGQASELRDALQMLLDLREAAPCSPAATESPPTFSAVLGPPPGGRICSPLSSGPSSRVCGGLLQYLQSEVPRRECERRPSL